MRRKLGEKTRKPEIMGTILLKYKDTTVCLEKSFLPANQYPESSPTKLLRASRSGIQEWKSIPEKKKKRQLEKRKKQKKTKKTYRRAYKEWYKKNLSSCKPNIRKAEEDSLPSRGNLQKLYSRAFCEYRILFCGHSCHSKALLASFQDIGLQQKNSAIFRFSNFQVSYFFYYAGFL
jgi:hypothetical protein